MALGPLPKLTEIKTELSSAFNNLIALIGVAGKTGEWDRQSKFANYSANILNISPEFMAFQFDGTPYSSNLCSVTSNIFWNVTKSESWITVFPSSGSNDGSFEVYCDFNPDLYNPRNGEVTVSGGGIERTLYIQQDAGEPI